MKDADLWVWCGIYPWDKEIYACVEIGWGEKYEHKIGPTIRNRLENNGLERYDEPNHPTYPYEAYTVEKSLTQLFGSSRSFEEQSRRATQWFTKHAKVLVRMLNCLERGM